MESVIAMDTIIDPAEERRHRKRKKNKKSRSSVRPISDPNTYPLNSTFPPVKYASKARADRVKVEVTVDFSCIHDVHTPLEQFKSSIVLRAKWEEPEVAKIPTEDRDYEFNHGDYWDPLLHIPNIMKIRNDDVIYWSEERDGYNHPLIFMERRIHAEFYEHLELDHFPVDTQELTVQVASWLSPQEIHVIQDLDRIPTVNTRLFPDGKEWNLYQHVRVQKELTHDRRYRDYLALICNDDEGKMVKPRDFHVSIGNRQNPFQAPTQHVAAVDRPPYTFPYLYFQCHVHRKTSFYGWNMFLPLFIITSLTFGTFATLPTELGMRLKITFIIMLAMLIFKMKTNMYLPQMPKLTYLDEYVLFGYILMGIQCITHIIVGTFATTEPPYANLLNLSFCCVLLFFHFLFHIVLWIILLYRYVKGRNTLRYFTNVYKTDVRYKKHEHDSDSYTESGDV